jgi:hypothetical protein
MNSKIKFQHRKPHLNNKAVINAQQKYFLRSGYFICYGAHRHPELGN